VEKKSDPEGGRTLPLPIFASVVFIVLVAGFQMAPAGPSGPGVRARPTVAQLWAQAGAGELDTSGSYFANDVIAAIQVDASNVTIAFSSLPGHAFTLEDYEWAITTFGLRAGLRVAVELEYEDGNWTVPLVFPASMLP